MNAAFLRFDQPRRIGVELPVCYAQVAIVPAAIEADVGWATRPENLIQRALVLLNELRVCRCVGEPRARVRAEVDGLVWLHAICVKGVPKWAEGRRADFVSSTVRGAPQGHDPCEGHPGIGGGDAM